MPSSSNTRERALKEIARHISCDNISQWNRSIGRLLDTGLSELGLHFILEKSSVLSDLVQMSELNVEDHVEEFVRNVSPIIWKMRYEHLHLMVLCLCSLPYRSVDTINYLRVDASLYPINFPPSVLKITLEGLLATYQVSSTETQDTKKKVAVKSKGLIRKLVETDNDGASPSLPIEVTSSPPPTESKSVKSQSLILLESVLDFNSLFLILPANLHEVIRDSFTQLNCLRVLCVELLISLEYSETKLRESLLVLLNHCCNRLEAPFPTEDILTDCLNSFLQHTNSHTHQVSHKIADWNKLFQKVNHFLTLLHSSEREFWTQSLHCFLQVDPSHLQRGIEEYYDLFCNRYETLQSLYQMSTLSQLSTLPNQSTVNLYFQTHIFLFSSEVLPLSKTIFLTHDDDTVTLPFSLESFSSSHSLFEIFHLLKEISSLESPELSQKAIMVLTHLLRLWGWGSQLLLPPHQIIQQIFEFWNDSSAHLHLEDSSVTVIEKEETGLICFISLLEICSQNNLHEEFLEIFVLDICSPSLRHRNLNELIDRMPLILDMTHGFEEELSAWVRINFLCSLAHSLNRSNCIRRLSSTDH
jgi:hypothetical protein